MMPTELRSELIAKHDQRCVSLIIICDAELEFYKARTVSRDRIIIFGYWQCIFCYLGYFIGLEFKANE